MNKDFFDRLSELTKKLNKLGIKPKECELEGSWWLKIPKWYKKRKNESTRSI